MLSRQAQQNASLDSLAALAAVQNEDEKSLGLLLATYDPASDEWALFLSGLMAHAVCAIHLAADSRGIPVSQVFGILADSIRSVDDTDAAA